MKLDFATLAFGYNVNEGGATPNWATALGQGKGHKINNSSEIDELLKGITYSSVPLYKLSSKVGKGGNMVFGEDKNSPFVIGAVFKKVYINDIEIQNGNYILLITRDTSKSHFGRLRVKYGPSNTYTDNDEVFSNEDFFSKVRHQLNLANDACFFVTNLDIVNQDVLILKTTIINPDGSESYKNTEALHKAWDVYFEKDKENSSVDKFLVGNNIVSNNIKFTTNILFDEIRNLIFFGAPGTGKSFKLNNKIAELNAEYERVTFHPDYSYANFVGTYKPTMVRDNSHTLVNSDKQEIISILTDKTKTAQEKYDLLYEIFKDDGLTRLPILLGIYDDEAFKTKKADGTDSTDNNSTERNHGKALRPYINIIENNTPEQKISYEYVPGPFMRTLVKALKSAMTDSPKPYLLVIEEINRANVAAVFGDVFQLLDRDENNISEYPITTSNDMRKYLSQELNIPENKLSEIRIPDNMFIWATMNSADQGVLPMDTAFKRRWDFEYIGIDDGEEKIKGKSFTINSNNGSIQVEWNELRKAINDELVNECKVNEDKLLGPFFISPHQLNENNFIRLFKNKVLMYLFEDAAKQKKSTLFQGCYDKCKTYSSICNEFDKIGVNIFCDEIVNAIYTNSVIENEDNV